MVGDLAVNAERTTLRGNSSATSGFTRTAGMAVDSATNGGTIGGHTAGVSGMLNFTVAWSIELLR